MGLWELLRDVALTGTAIYVILSQVYSPHPSDVLLGTALALTAPAAADHVRALVSGRTGSRTSPGSGDSQPGPSSSPQEAPGE